MIKLWPFPGGVQLEAHKLESSLAPLSIAPLPTELVYPLVLRNGEPAQALVEAGERVLKHQVIVASADPRFPPLHAASSGWVRGIEQRYWPHPSGLPADCLVIAVDGEDESEALHGCADYAALTPAELCARIHAAGIVGLGGAAFPTAQKLAAGQRYAIDTLVLNGAECEPYIACDDSLLRHFAESLLGGALILMHTLGASRCLLGIEADMPEALAALATAQATGNYAQIEVVPVPAIYPAGGERQLIKCLTGREVPAYGFPAEVGVVCQNVATAAAVQQAIIHGQPLVSRIVSITGQGVRRPQNVLARIGTPIAELVEFCGGYAESAQRLIHGGPMMGFALATDDMPILKSSNCLLVAGRDELASEKKAMACIRCGACAEACPAMLLPQELYWHSRAENLQRLLDYHLPACIECGCCDIVCPSHIPLVQYFRAAKGKLAAKEQERLQADHARLRHQARLARKEQEKVEKAEIAKRKRELLSRVSE